MKAIRSAGYAGSNGKKAAPALNTASWATTMSAERGKASATTFSGPAPPAIKRWANLLARASRSA